MRGHISGETGLAAIALVLTLAPSVCAADGAAPRDGVAPVGSSSEGRPPGLLGPDSPLPIEVRLTGDTSSAVGFRSSTGTLAATHGGVSVSSGTPPIGAVLPLFAFEGEASLYDLRRTDAITASDPSPWKALYSARFAPAALVFLGPGRKLILSASLTFAGEATCEVQDALTEGAFGAAAFELSSTFELTVGVVAQTRLEHRPLIFPIVGFDWKPVPSFELAVDKDGLRASYEAASRLWLQASFKPELREYRLSETSDSLPEGVVRDERFLARLGLDWRPLEGLSLALFGGAVLWERITLDDHIGRIVSRNTTKDPAALVGAQLQARF